MQMDDPNYRSLPSRRDLRRPRSGRDKEHQGTLRVRLSSASATVLIGALVMLGTIGLLRIVIPTSASVGASSSQEISEEKEQDPPALVPAESGINGDDRTQSQAVAESDSFDESDPLIVFVTGAVNEPGVVSVPIGSRLEVAISEAGGLTEQADLVSVNLARPIEDGEHIHVLAEGEQRASAVPGTTDQPPGDQGQAIGCVDLNSADQTQLETLDGVGPKTAAHIIEWRETNGGFASNEELLAISGIGQKLYARISVGLCGG